MGGSNPQAAQRHIVGELVAHSQEEVKRRVLEAIGPTRFEAECKLHSRGLAVLHELRSLEAQVRSMHRYEEAKAMGFDFNLAKQARRGLPAGPATRAASSPLSDVFS